MTEEIKTQAKNTVATVGMWLSIIGLILLITVIGGWVGFILLFLWFILWIIGLFHKPRWKAWIAVIIPLVVFVCMIILWIYLFKNVKPAALDFVNHYESRISSLSPTVLDDDRFEHIIESEVDSMFTNISNDEWKAMYETSTGSNKIQKISYLFFGLLQQALDNSLEVYENNQLPITSSWDNIFDINLDVEEPQQLDTNESSEAENTGDNTQETIEQTENKKPTETFDDKEKQDIEQVLNLLQ